MRADCAMSTGPPVGRAATPSRSICSPPAFWSDVRSVQGPRNAARDRRRYRAHRHFAGRQPAACCPRHETLVERVAREMTRAGRVALAPGLSLRARLPPDGESEKARWCIARPDLFSIRNTSVEAYTQPIVLHEVKVSRADLLRRSAQARQARCLSRPGWRMLVRVGVRRARHRPIRRAGRDFGGNAAY